MPRVSYAADVLRIDGEEIELSHEIGDVVVMDDLVVVLLSPPTDVLDDRNVVAFDADGNRLWRIEPPTEGMEGQVYRHIKFENDRLEANNWDQYKYEVDLETGSVTPVRFLGK